MTLIHIDVIRTPSIVSCIIAAHIFCPHLVQPHVDVSCHPLLLKWSTTVRCKAHAHFRTRYHSISYRLCPSSEIGNVISKHWRLHCPSKQLVFLLPTHRPTGCPAHRGWDPQPNGRIKFGHDESVSVSFPGKVSRPNCIPANGNLQHLIASYIMSSKTIVIVATGIICNESRLPSCDDVNG